MQSVFLLAQSPENLITGNSLCFVYTYNTYVLIYNYEGTLKTQIIVI